MESVPAGAASFPVTTAGASAAQRGRTEAAADAAWTVGVSELKPTRNAARLVFSIEDAARIPGLETALTRDLRMALTEGVDRAIFVGDDGANENGADITGLQTATGLTEKTIKQADKVRFRNPIGVYRAGGRHPRDGARRSERGRGNRRVAIVGGYGHQRGGRKTLAAFLRTAGLSWSARAQSRPQPRTGNSGNGKFGAFVGLGKSIDGAGVAAVWEAGELIRDPYSGASKGEIALTLSYLWAFGLPRASNFARLKFVA